MSCETTFCIISYSSLLAAVLMLLDLLLLLLRKYLRSKLLHIPRRIACLWCFGEGEVAESRVAACFDVDVDRRIRASRSDLQ